MKMTLGSPLVRRALGALLVTTGLVVAAGLLPRAPAARAPEPCAATSTACTAPEGVAKAAVEVPQGKPRLLEFVSAHCAVCQRMAPIVRDLEARCAAEGGTILRVAVDDDAGEALAARYGVRLLPTFVAIDAAGIEVERVVGEQSPARLASLLTDVRGEACPAPL